MLSIECMVTSQQDIADAIIENTKMIENLQKSIRDIEDNNNINNNINNNNNIGFTVKKNIFKDILSNNYDMLIRFLKLSFETSQSSIRMLKFKIESLDKEICALKREKEEKQTTIIYDDTLCSICMDNKKDHAYIGCGHMCVCSGCADRWINMCPICRTPGHCIKIIS